MAPVARPAAPSRAASLELTGAPPRAAAPAPAVDAWGLPLLSEAERRAFERARAALPPSRRAELDRLLARAGEAGRRADAAAERALLQRAVAARPIGAARWQELVRFAAAIRGLPRDDLLLRTTLIDSDPSLNTSRVDTHALGRKRPREPRGSDHRADNDGLVQRFQISCGPAAAEVLLGRLDPLHAFAVHESGGAQAPKVGSPSDRLQSSQLRAFGITPIERRGLYEYRRLRLACRELVEAGVLAPAERLAVLRYARTPRAVPTDLVTSGLGLLRRRRGLPSDSAIARMRRAHPGARQLGTDAVQMRRILRAVIGAAVAPERRLRTRTLEVAPDRSSRRFVARSAEALLRACASDGAGAGAILGTTDHWWTVVGARRHQGVRTFLIHDPWTGRTTWVPEPELEDGSFARRRFGWRQKERVDTLVLLALEPAAA